MVGVAVSPSLTAGSGLKRYHTEQNMKALIGISQLNRWERIETTKTCYRKSVNTVSPSLTAGSGLKLNDLVGIFRRDAVSPSLTAGSGLKLNALAMMQYFMSVSPSLTAGSGLKQCNRQATQAGGKEVSPSLTAGSGLKRFAGLSSM